jgi:hypothetical protein
MPARAHDHGHLDLVVDEPAAAGAAQAAQRRAFADPRAGAAQQVMIELRAKDAEADRAFVSGLDRTAAGDSGSKGGDRLERPAAAVLVDVELERVDQGRCDPTRADLVPRKPGAVDDENVQSLPAQRPGAARACRPSADDEDVQSAS